MGGWVSNSQKKSVSKVHGSTLLVLRDGGGGGVGVKFPEKKRYVTPE